MKRAVLAGALVLASLPACQRAGPAEARGGGRAAAAQAGPDAGAASVRIDPAAVERYLRTLEEGLEPWREALREWKQRTGAGADLGAVGALRRFEQDPEARAWLVEIHAQLRDELGLSPEAARAVEELAGEVSRAQAAFAVTGGEEALEEARRRLGELGDAGSAHEREELTQAVQTLEQMREMPELRRRFGDPAVDAMLRGQHRLEALERERLRLAAELFGR